MVIPFIAVHAGAGTHSDSAQSKLKKLCSQSCSVSIEQLKAGIDSTTALKTAVTILENSPLTNAGLGSCLSLEGTVECDASVMRGDGACGIIGAVSGVKNPIELAHQLLLEQSKGLLSLGRIPPVCLCGNGARLWAESNGVTVCEYDQLISDCSKEIYIDHMSRLNDSFGELPTKKSAIDTTHEQQLDTVGGVCIDSNGVISACSSSGGISLKHPGRIGQAGMYGCGCWAEGNSGHDRIATSTSGVGETLIKTSLAKEVGRSVLSSNFSSLTKTFHEVYLDHKCPKLAGVIVLNVLSTGLADFSWAHSTNDMLLGYMSAVDTAPKIVLSKLGDGGGMNRSPTEKDKLCVGGISIKL